MSKDQRVKFNKWKNQFSQDYIMVATKISEKQSAGESNHAAAIDAVQLEVTSKVAELRKAMRGAAQTDRTEQFFPLAQRLAREIAQSGATQYYHTKTMRLVQAHSDELCPVLLYRPGLFAVGHSH